MSESRVLYLDEERRLMDDLPLPRRGCVKLV